MKGIPRAATVSTSAAVGSIAGGSIGCALGFVIAGPIGGAVLFAIGFIGGGVGAAAMCAQALDGRK